MALCIWCGVFVTASCDSGDPAAGPSGEPTPGTQSQTTSTSPEASPTASEAWRSKYTPDQLKRFDAALERWQQFSARYNEAARRGVDTPGIEAMFGEYSTTAAVDYSAFLDQFVRGGARLEVPAVPIWFSAKEVGPSWVVIKQCTDFSKVRVTVNGEVAKQPRPFRRLITVRMSKTPGNDWMKVRANSGELQPCGTVAA